MPSLEPGKGDSYSFSASKRWWIFLPIATLVLVLIVLVHETNEDANIIVQSQTLTNAESSIQKHKEWAGYDVTLRSPPPIPIRGVEFNKTLSKERKNLNYEGGGEPEHVGGYKDNDTETYDPLLWTWMVNILQVSSLIDVGCGIGISTRWFLDNGVNATCVEGSPSAVKISHVPNNVVEHDYTKGPWWDSDKIYDVAWTCEFLEHVDFKYVANYMATFSRARLVFATHSFWGGWHHVLVRESWWWVQLFKDYGFEYLPEPSERARHIRRDRQTHFRVSGMIFRNLRFRWTEDFEKNYFYKVHDWEFIGTPPGKAW